MHEYMLLIYILKFNDVIEYLRDRLIDYRLARRSRTSSCIPLHPEFCEEFFCKTTKQTSYIFQTNRHAQRKIVFAKKELQKVNIVKNLVSNFLKLNHVYYLLIRGTPGIYLILALIAKSNILNRDHKIIFIFIPDCVHKLLFH